MTDSWNLLKSTCADCRNCGLANGRRNVVFGVGDESSRVMFIGEGPGEQEDISGEAFVGPAGKLLDKYLEAIGLDRNRVYIANMVKCRPPSNRDPHNDELDACLPYLRRQTKLVNPDIIVCLGRVAACRLISPDFKVTRQHGNWYKRGKFYMMGTFHPAALLRNGENKPAALEDFIALRSKMRELGIWNGDDV